jgi:hypothetical protein
MKKILYITDSHFREKPPIGRTSSFLEDVTAKHLEFGEMCQAIKPDIVIHGGDFFDGPSPSMLTVLVALRIIEESGIKPWHMVLGNHTWRGRWEDWKRRSALTLLEELGYIKIYPHFFKMEIHNKVIISRHEQYVEKPVIWDHHLWKDYDGSADIFLVSDYHPFQGSKVITRKDGGRTRFVAPGAITRLKRTESDMTRPPCAALLKISPDASLPDVYTDVELKFLKFKTARPAETVFHDVIQCDESQERRQSYDEAVSLLKELGDKLRVYSIEDALRIIAKRTKARKEVLDLCLSRVHD